MLQYMYYTSTCKCKCHHRDDVGHLPFMLMICGNYIVNGDTWHVTETGLAVHGGPNYLRMEVYI